MRTCIVYSSRTGNTRAVGERLAEGLELPLFRVEEAPSAGYDCFILGFWTWRGGPDAAMAAFMSRLRDKDVFFFGTMVAGPDSPHAERCAGDQIQRLRHCGRGGGSGFPRFPERRPGQQRRDPLPPLPISFRF